MSDEFAELTAYLQRVPGIIGTIGQGYFDDGNWWVKFKIDIDHPLAWNVVQALGSVLNYVSLAERLPTVFKPVSPDPRLNGGARDYLSWVIESSSVGFEPTTCADWLANRLPDPVEDICEWPSAVE